MRGIGLDVISPGEALMRSGILPVVLVVIVVVIVAAVIVRRKKKKDEDHT